MVDERADNIPVDDSDDDEHDDEVVWPDEHAELRPIDKFRKTATGSVLAAGMLGLADVLEGREREEPAIVVDAGGEPVDPNLLLRLDPDNPADSIVLVRKPTDT